MLHLQHDTYLTESGILRADTRYKYPECGHQAKQAIVAAAAADNGSE